MLYDGRIRGVRFGRKLYGAFALSIVLVTSCLAQDGHDGGDGTANMPGCPGGTQVSPDGKFYLPDTTVECNPSADDRKTKGANSGNPGPEMPFG